LRKGGLEVVVVAVAVAVAAVVGRVDAQAVHGFG
jgi:hypothetical protein